MRELVSNMLAEFLKDEKTFAAAEKLYSESFRDSKSFRVADGFYSLDELVSYLMTPIYAQQTSEVPHFCDDDEDYFDMIPEPEEIKPGLSQQQAELIVDNLEFVELCNYKGEGEGFELLERVSHLRVFHSKYNYA